MKKMILVGCFSLGVIGCGRRPLGNDVQLVEALQTLKDSQEVSEQHPYYEAKVTGLDEDTIQISIPSVQEENHLITDIKLNCSSDETEKMYNPFLLALIKKICIDK